MNKPNNSDNCNNATLSSFKDESNKFPIIPPIFIINPFKALIVLLNSGTQISEYIANWFPTLKVVKKYANNPMDTKKIQEKATSKGLAVKNGTK